ncbi:hypothetical protein J2128_001712 [Methanomicrobium sp. W14]|uniref:hypothetical protein n=1 Tax=Methanomicrobium sp. W14 TaxID=2817839 RepID=UPI001AE7BB1E|nr:hypothetical protein [Methanomicrobium sp. W14]
MERLDDDGQWIVLMGFIISVGIFFLAIIINQSVMVGQTTSEGVLEFPKSEIQDIRAEILYLAENGGDTTENMTVLQNLAMNREDTVLWYNITENRYSDSYYTYTEAVIHYNNGVTSYDETYLLPKKE